MDTFNNISDQELESRFKILIVRERKILHLILQYTLEIERRKLYLKKAYPTLRDYLVKEIGYSGGSAQRRIDAIRLMNQVPELSSKIEDGKVNLSQIALLTQGIKQKESETQTKIAPEVKKEILKDLENKNGSESQRLVAQKLDLSFKKPEQRQIQKDESVHLSVTLTKEQYEKYLACQDFLGSTLSQSNKNPNLANVLETLFDQYLYAKKKTQLVTIADSKTLTSAKRKEVFKKFPHCQYKDPVTGRSCQSTFKLEVDHIQPRWAGGNHKMENLTLLCSNHNKFRYKKQALII